MVGLTSHLRDDRLFDCYLSTRGSGRLEPSVAAHLATCAECAARFEALRSLMDDLREAGAAEADAVFTTERLRAQEQQIAKRLALVGRSARVLSFPRSQVRRHLSAATGRTLPRWAAATAAAGLVAGVAAGMFLERAGHQHPDATVARRAIATSAETSRAGGSGAAPRPSGVAVPGPGDPADDMEPHERFMFDLEVAAGQPRTAELTAYDELTPHISEIGFSVPGR